MTSRQLRLRRSRSGRNLVNRNAQTLRFDEMEPRLLLSATQAYLDPVSSPSDITSVVAGDFNINNVADFAVARSNGEVDVYLGHGSQRFAATPSATIHVNTGGLPITSMTTGEFFYNTQFGTDSPDNVDIAVLSGDHLFVEHGNGFGTSFTQAADINLQSYHSISAHPVSVSAGNIYGSGYEDMVVLMSDGQLVNIKGAGDEQFSVKPVTANPLQGSGSYLSLVVSNLAIPNFGVGHGVVVLDSSGHITPIVLEQETPFKGPTLGLGVPAVGLAKGFQIGNDAGGDLYVIGSQGTVQIVPELNGYFQTADSTYLKTDADHALGISATDTTDTSSSNPAVFVVSADQAVDVNVNALSPASVGIDIAVNGPDRTVGTIGKFDQTTNLSSVVAYTDGTIRIGAGDGAGHFTETAPAGQLAASTSAVAVAVGSFNTTTDDDSDVVYLGNDGTIGIFFGNGSGGFKSTTPQVIDTLFTDANPTIVVGKFFGDTHDDIAVMTRNGVVQVFQGKGDGTFTALPVFPSLFAEPYPTALDLIALTVSPGVVGLAVGYSDPTIGVYPTADPDDVKIVHTSDSVVSMVGGRFSDSTHAYDDIAYTDSRNRVNLLQNDGNGTFTGTGTVYPLGVDQADTTIFATSLVAGDFDQDGHVDIAALEEGSGIFTGQVDLLLGATGGGFVTNHVVVLGQHSRYGLSLNAADLDGSGHLDLTVVNQKAVVTYLASTTPAKVTAVETPATYEGDPVDPLNPGYETPFDFIIQLDSTPLRGSIAYQTKDGTAKAGDAYLQVVGTANFDGDHSESFTVTAMVKPNYTIDPQLRQFSLDLSNLQGLDLNGKSEATQTIIDDDGEAVNTTDDFHVISTTVVNSANTPPPISLAKAILVANAMNSLNHNPDGETITFKIPSVSSTDTLTINVNQAMPAITGKTHINAFSQPTLNPDSRIILNSMIVSPAGPSSIPVNAFDYGNGLTLSSRTTGLQDQWTTADGSIIEGFFIKGFQGDGILVDTQTTGSSGLITLRDDSTFSNSGDGVGIISGNVAISNMISNNNQGSGYYTIAPHTVFANVVAAGNAFSGIEIESGSSTVTLGTIDSNKGNGITIFGSDAVIDDLTISNNMGDGIYIGGTGARVQRSTITNSHSNGIEIVPVIYFPVALAPTPVSHPPDSQTTGINETSISGSGMDGIRVDSQSYVSITFNHVTGNALAGISLTNSNFDAITTNDVENNAVGIRVSASAHNLIGGDGNLVVLGNTLLGNVVGIWIENAPSTGNVVNNNLINSTVDGIKIAGASGNRIGSEQQTNVAASIRSDVTSNPLIGGLNTIEGGSDAGISLEGGASNNLVIGNFISFASIGIHLVGATGNSIGYLADAVSSANSFQVTGNTIRGNSDVGIMLNNQSNGNFIQNNFVDGNAHSNITISASDYNHVFGNTIGTPSTNGAIYPGPELDGIILRAGASGNMIGYGTLADGKSRGNTIDAASGNGILMLEGAHNNKVFGDVIHNGRAGIYLLDAVDNAIGQLGATDRPGTDFGNTITDNLNIGLVLNGGSNDNAIAGNLISGNTNSNLTVNASNDNQVFGNWIGTDSSGLKAYSSSGSQGVVIRGGSIGNEIGFVTDTPGQGVGNVISGNVGDGVLITEGSSQNLVAGNIIGLGADGSTILPNYNGVEFRGAPNNIVGALFTRLRNLIFGNRNANVVSDSSFG